MAEKLNIHGDRLEISNVLRIGECEELRSLLTNLLANQTQLTTDLAAVEECDVAGLQLLLAAWKTAQSTGKVVKFVRPSSAVVESCEALGLTLPS